MKIIIPMAGKGSRLRPHTLTVPKPLIPIAGKPIVQRLIEDISKVVKDQSIDEIIYITGDFGAETEALLTKIADDLGAKASIYKQENPAGTAHAIACARDSIQGPVIVAFADTLFRADFNLDQHADGVVWVKKVENPSAFGVVKLDDYGVVTGFVEKPKTFVSDLAIIGIYYFKSGEALMKEIDYLLDNDIRIGGEYQLTDALERLRAGGAKLRLGKVDEWMDCGNKAVTLETNARILELKKDEMKSFPKSCVIKNSTIVPPCFIGENVHIENSKIGPYVSLGNGTHVSGSNVEHSLILENTIIKHGNLGNCMIGNSAEYYGVLREISLGDFSVLGFASSKD